MGTRDLPPIQGEWAAPWPSSSRSSPVSKKLTAAQAQQLTEKSLGGLGPIAGGIFCVLAQAELHSAPLTRMGFASLMTAQSFAQDVEQVKSSLEDASALLIVTLGDDVADALRVVATADLVADSPPLIVAILTPLHSLVCVAAAGTDGCLVRAAQLAAADPQASYQLGGHLAQARKELLAAGVDDAIGLFAGEALQPNRVLEVIQRSEILSEKVCKIVDEHVSAAEAQGAAKLQAAFENFLMAMPGRTLEHIPCKDASVKESYGEDGSIVSIGKYQFSAKLGSGSFGTVYQAEHPDLGSCAVKLISKSCFTKSAGRLISLDRELCFLLHLEPHPNIVRASGVMHGEKFVACVMEPAGQLNLEKYTKSVICRLDTAALPREVALSYCGQQAAAVSHLHASLVCHRDLKPENWIVSDCGAKLRLADFGLAVQVCNASQPLKQSCGSLPYVAPEVYGQNIKGKAPTGYNGFAADSWSLGVGYMELLLGSRCIERMLGWRARPPADPRIVLHGLESLAEQPAAVAEEEPSGLSQALCGLLVLQPAGRWSVNQVLGPRGLGLGQQVRPPRRGRRMSKEVAEPKAQSEL